MLKVLEQHSSFERWSFKLVALLILGVTIMVCSVSLKEIFESKSISLEEQKIIRGLLEDDQQAVKEVLLGGKLTEDKGLKYLILYKDQFGE